MNAIITVADVFVGREWWPMSNLADRRSMANIDGLLRRSSVDMGVRRSTWTAACRHWHRTSTVVCRHRTSTVACRHRHRISTVDIEPSTSCTGVCSWSVHEVTADIEDRRSISSWMVIDGHLEFCPLGRSRCGCHIRRAGQFRILSIIIRIPYNCRASLA